jgi:hypothetical protein
MLGHSELITCGTCKQEKELYFDEENCCVYQEKCLCDKQKVNKKKIDEALHLIGELLKNGESFYAK